MARSVGKEVRVAEAKDKAAARPSYRGEGHRQNIAKYLGEPKFRRTRRKRRTRSVSPTGWPITSYGGEVLATEVTVVPGKGKLVLTGKLGEVMQESAQAAMSYVRSRADAFGLARDFYQKIDIHVHFPDAIPRTDRRRA